MEALRFSMTLEESTYTPKKQLGFITQNKKMFLFVLLYGHSELLFGPPLNRCLIIAWHVFSAVSSSHHLKSLDLDFSHPFLNEFSGFNSFFFWI